MAVVTVRSSFLLATMFAILLFCLMQIQRSWLSSSKLHTILGGYLGSLLFILLLTAVGNMESMVFGPRFHTKIFPEVVTCLVLSAVASGMIHRVCITTSFIFSILALFCINKTAKSAHPQPTSVAVGPVKKKK